MVDKVLAHSLSKAGCLLSSSLPKPPSSFFMARFYTFSCQVGAHVGCQVGSFVEDIFLLLLISDFSHLFPATLVVGLTPRCSQSVLIQILLQILKICKKAQSQSLLRMDLTSGQALSLHGKIRGFSHPFTVLLSRSSINFTTDDKQSSGPCRLVRPYLNLLYCMHG
jgi:hypothetical protein